MGIGGDETVIENVVAWLLAVLQPEFDWGRRTDPLPREQPPALGVRHPDGTAGPIWGPPELGGAADRVVLAHLLLRFPRGEQAVPGDHMLCAPSTSWISRSIRRIERIMSLNLSLSADSAARSRSASNARRQILSILYRS
jgi:hypothetical protein